LKAPAGPVGTESGTRTRIVSTSVIFTTLPVDTLAVTLYSDGHL
jgi:hypothetical protein